nr:unnamed protein product [Callosobruchus analis]
MPCCAAVNCSNSSTKGFLMKHFPKDPERRRQWLIKTGRDNWIPTDHSCLCGIHFAPDMWERTRGDGTRRLKNNAVPTIFSFYMIEKKRSLPQRQLVSCKKIKVGMYLAMYSNSNEPHIKNR